MNDFKIITAEELSRGVTSLPLRPNQTSQFGQSALSGKELQKKFDYLAKDVIAKKFNDLIRILSSTDVLSYFKITDTETLDTFVATLKNNLSDDGKISAKDPAEGDKKTVDIILATLYYAIEAVKTFVNYKSGEGTIANIYETKENVSKLESSLEGKISTAKEEATTTAATDATDKANAAKTEAISAADAKADSKISEHNSSTTAHGDIRTAISALQEVINEFFAKDADNDANLDRLVEIVTLINSNADAIDTIATNKVSKTDIVNNLTSDATDKPLSAAQGAALKALIDALETVTDLKLPSDNVDTEALTDNNARVPSSALVKRLLDNFEGGGGIDLPADAMSVFTEAFLTNGSHGLLYHLYDDEEYAVCVGMGECTETNIDIGSIAKGYPVTKVGVYKQAENLAPLFDGADHITGLVIPDSVTELCDFAFSWCTELTAVKLSKSLKDIPKGAFAGSSALPEIMIPSGVTKIGNSAFGACLALQTVYLPRSLKTIGADAFSGIKEGAVVYYEGSQAEWSAISIDSLGNSSLTNATIHYNTVYGG